MNQLHLSDGNFVRECFMICHARFVADGGDVMHEIDLRPERFQRERWSLFVEFDPSSDARANDTVLWFVDGSTERYALAAHVAKTFGGLPEEVPELTLQHDDGRIEITDRITDWLATVVEWIFTNTIPREVKLVRNEER